MAESSEYILIYILSWGVVLYYYWKKKGTIDSGNFIISSYLFYGILSFILYNHPYSNFNKLTLFPFIYLFLMLFVALYPVLKHDTNKSIYPPSKTLVNGTAYLYIFLSVLIIPSVLSNIVEGFLVVLLNPSGGDDLYSSYRMGSSANSERNIFTYFKVAYNFLSDIGVLLFFYLLTTKRKNNYVLFGLLFAISISLLESIANGLRTSMTMKILQLIAGYFLFKQKLSERVRKVTKVVGLSFVSLVALLIVVINFSRYGASEKGGDYNLLYYAGQANLYFDEYCMDAGGTRNGDRVCNSFKKWLMIDNVPKDLEDVRARYSYMKLGDEVFSTFIGDFALDFGPVATAIIIFSFSTLFIFLTRSNIRYIKFHQLIIVFFVMTVCVQGGMYLFNFSFKNNIKIVAFLFFYFLFKINDDFHLKAKSK